MIAQRKNKRRINKFLIHTEKFETTDLNEKVTKVKKCEDAMAMIRGYKDFYNNKKNIICIKLFLRVCQVFMNRYV